MSDNLSTSDTTYQTSKSKHFKRYQYPLKIIEQNIKIDSVKEDIEDQEETIISIMIKSIITHVKIKMILFHMIQII